MLQTNIRIIGQWLRAGAPDSGGPELDAAWTKLLDRLPDESPSDAFADRVMARVAEARHAARDLAPRLRWLLVACLVLVGSGAMLMPADLVLAPLPVGGLIAALAGGIKAVAGCAAQGAAVWRFLADVGKTASIVLATPQAITFLASIALVSAGALRLLFELTYHDGLAQHDRRITDAASR